MDTIPPAARLLPELLSVRYFEGFRATAETNNMSRSVSNSLRKPVAPVREQPSTKLGRSVLERIGNTPLVRLVRVAREVPAVQVLAKAEWFNPGGSVKDRAAASIVLEAIDAGEL